MFASSHLLPRPQARDHKSHSWRFALNPSGSAACAATPPDVDGGSRGRARRRERQHGGRRGYNDRARPADFTVNVGDRRCYFREDSDPVEDPHDQPAQATLLTCRRSGWRAYCDTIAVTDRGARRRGAAPARVQFSCAGAPAAPRRCATTSPPAASARTASAPCSYGKERPVARLRRSVLPVAEPPRGWALLEGGAGGLDRRLNRCGGRQFIFGLPRALCRVTRRSPQSDSAFIPVATFSLSLRRGALGGRVPRPADARRPAPGARAQERVPKDRSFGSTSWRRPCAASPANWRSCSSRTGSCASSSRAFSRTSTTRFGEVGGPPSTLRRRPRH